MNILNIGGKIVNLMWKNYKYQVFLRITVNLQFQCGRELRGDDHDKGDSQLEWKGKKCPSCV